jgi:hypothetical protein
MNSQATAGLYAWSKDLEASRDVLIRERPAYAMLLGWLERFRLNQGLPAGRDACERFWKESVMARPREPWQAEQWAGAIRWYLRWLENRYETGGEVRSLEERVRMAVEKAGARRGLALRTRETYGRHAGQFARWTGDAREVRKPEKGRDYLSCLVSERRVAFSTQKQALNGLVFFFKEVCGLEEVDLEVRLRKTEPRLPVVL